MLVLALALAAATAFAQKDGPAPALNPNPTDTNNPRLVGKAFPYNQLPFQVDTTESPRGTQQGYNICNSTTEGPNSLCQTLIVNSLQDFCIWAPPTLNGIENSEGEVVAWCTQPGHGARLIPPGTITGAQFIKTPSYIEFTALIVEENVNVPKGNGGGELDSGGQDNRGNPIGGVAYSNNLPSTPGQITQSRVWHEFIGGNMVCMKFCDNKAPNAAGICRHTLDELGCFTNIPAAYQPGVFLSCEGDDQAPVQVGVTAVPASRNCQTFASSDLWPTAASSSSSASTAAPTSSGAPGSGSSSSPLTFSTGGSSSISTTGGSSAPGSPTTSGGQPSQSQSQTGAASTMRAGAVVAIVAGLVGVAFYA